MISMKKRIYHTANGEYPGHRLTFAEKSAHLYHYTSFVSFVKIWLSQRLLFSPLSKMNDVQEKSVRCASSNPNSIPILKAYDEIRRKYKQISFTMDYDSYFKGCMSTIMWGHYADKCNGVCIEFDASKLSFPEGTLYGFIHYKKAMEHNTPIPTSVKTIEDIDKYIRRNSRRILFTKQSGWREENEFRVVSANADYLDITGAITAIYLTSFKSTECLLAEKLVNDTVHVKFLHYIGAEDNLSLPVLIDTRKIREQLEYNLIAPEVIDAEVRQKEHLAMDILHSAKSHHSSDSSNE